MAGSDVIINTLITTFDYNKNGLRHSIAQIAMLFKINDLAMGL